MLPPDRAFPSQSLVDMAPKYILEQFLQQELLINITEHEVSRSSRCCGEGLGAFSAFPIFRPLSPFTVGP